MALFSIKLNVEEISLIHSNEGIGSSFYLKIDLEKIPEKKDQSVFPEIVELDGDVSIIGGLNNIPRNLVEFKLQNPGINLFYGTPSQIILTMRNNAKSNKKFEELPKFTDYSEIEKYLKHEEDLKITLFPCLTNNYNILSQICRKFFNMDISDRTIQRIIYEEFEPLKCINFDYLIHSKQKKNDVDKCDDSSKNIKYESIPKIYEDQKFSSRFKDEEIRYIMDVLIEKINKEGQKHLIKVKDNYVVKQNNNNIQINIELEEIN